MEPSPPAVPPADIAAHYDVLDPYYRDLWGEHVHHGLWLDGRESPQTAVENLSRRVIAALNLRPGDRVADIGCGYGATARMVAEAGDVTVTGLTLSAAQKAQADRITVTRGRVEVVRQDWQERQFPPASLDALFALESLEHMADKAGFAAMARTAVRPGGRVVVATWLAADRVAPWEQRYLLDAICNEGRLAPLVTADELRRIFAAAGLVEVRVEDLSDRVAATWTVVLRRMLLRFATRFSYWKFLWASRGRESVFALTAARIRLAYARGSFRYGFMVWESPAA